MPLSTTQSAPSAPAAPAPAPAPATTTTTTTVARATLDRVARAALRDWLAHHASSKGAALAFYTLFSLAPMLLLVLGVAGFFYGDQAARGELFLQLRGLLGQQGAQAIQLVLAGAQDHQQGRLATLLAGALLLLGATSVFAELKDSLDLIWQVPPPRRGGLWDLLRTRLLSFGIVLVLAFLLMVSLVVSALLTLLEHYWNGIWRDATALLAALNALLGFAVITALFAVIFKLLPRVRLSWRDVLVGALGTALLFTLGKHAIGAYIGNSGVGNSFGAAGSLAALLMWVYYSAQIFFLGAEFARQYALQMGSLRPLAPAKNQAPPGQT
ncbi:YihY/virulence factor BrkB family protein [Rugamonas sp. CCM 8940]|uniref:YihY/virulence factor BrkB family protein n=1 Tax=Rugamonas sp. CCM 8940 TaxID=2765359 RepID=UPI0018F37B9E|nr:YihY/virulence factor BrkB family protein [Rugamonas sp. CCM 8940]MBJ7309271.1 YihY/virulence factor BrkB family protein [Rugamonas sp. CCM 8940]